MSKLLEALRWLAEELSASDADFRERFKKGADDLRDGLIAHGFAKVDKKQGRYAVNESGLRKLEAMGGVDG